MKTFSIGNIEVGNPASPLVVPEIGINHGGSLEVAKIMVDAACRAGARLVKHQTHVVEDEMAPVARGVVPGNADRSIYEIMQGCALSEEDEWELKCYAESLGMEFLSTPFSRAAADRLESFGVRAYKIGSGELNNHPLIRHIARFGKPMIISTGMNDIASVKRAVDIVEGEGVDYALMHTTNLYPTRPDQVRLGALDELMGAFPDTPCGLSDHTRGNLACISALARGALLVERHFTDTMDREGPDIVCSMDEKALGELLKAAREVPLMLGGSKRALPEERVTMDFAFATVVSIAPIAKGEELTMDNIWVKRPGTGGIKAEDFEALLGKHALVDIGKDVQLSPSMVGPF